jgi:hypothetical protein
MLFLSFFINSFIRFLLQRQRKALPP